jgi:OPT family oligopeptide transporter
MLMKGGNKKLDLLAAIETPGSWFIIGQFVGLVGLALMAKVTFDMPYWQSFIAVILSFALALVACRVTGETDTTPVGAMGKITQLTFGALSPGNMNVNLMAANITAGAATSSADLLTDLKSGYLLGANPRKQFIAQFAGIFIGTLVTVAAFRILVPNASVLGTDQFPAPAAQTWKGVAEAMAQGLSAMHPVKVWSIVIGGLIGLILPILSRLFPKKQNWIPSAAGIGLAWVFQWFYGLLFFVGALIGYGWKKRNSEQCEEYLFPVASGVVAGGALMGVVLVFWESGWEILKQFLGQ